MKGLLKQSIVAPVDFSPASRAAVDFALGLVERADQVHVLHVLVDIAAAEPGLLWNVLDHAQRRDDALRRLRAEFPRPEHDGLRLAVAFGDPGEEISRFAESLPADLVVLAAHGRSGARRLLLGSVAERVLRLARGEVLVLKDAAPGE